MGFLNKIVSKVTGSIANGIGRGIGRSVEQKATNVANQTANKVLGVNKGGANQYNSNVNQTENSQYNCQSNGQSENLNSGFMPSATQTSAAMGLASASIGIGMSAMTNMKFCANCKQVCDINAKTCPICGSSSFKSAMQLADEERINENINNENYEV